MPRMQGVDVIVFTAGIGENSHIIRESARRLRVYGRLLGS